jgi:NitT/TauT family transport system substrate-binding protein
MSPAIQGRGETISIKMDSRSKNRQCAEGSGMARRPIAQPEGMARRLAHKVPWHASCFWIPWIFVTAARCSRQCKVRVAFMIAKLGISAAVVALVAGTASLAAANEKVTFGTNWLAQAEHGGYYQAVADGTYAACGLDVTIQMGGPQGSLRPLLLAGKIQFYMGGDLLSAFDAVQQNIPLRVVAASFQKGPQVLMTHPGQGLDKWEDLKNADQFIISDEGVQTYFQWLVTDFGWDSAKRVPYTFNPAPFIANPKSIQQGYITSEPLAVEREGKFKPNLFLLADYGFDPYATTIETMQETIDKRPEVVKCFVDGSAKGWYNYLYGDNKAANEAIKKDNPDITDEQIAFSIEKMKEYGIVDSGDTETGGIGAMTDARIQSFYDKMVHAKVLPAGIDLKKAYTLDFVNKGVGLELKKK